MTRNYTGMGQLPILLFSAALFGFMVNRTIEKRLVRPYLKANLQQSLRIEQITAEGECLRVKNALGTIATLCSEDGQLYVPKRDAVYE